jgi:hypothetical protein
MPALPTQGNAHSLPTHPAPFPRPPRPPRSAAYRELSLRKCRLPWLDEERAAQAEARRVAFWEVLHRLAAEYGVQVVLTPKRSAARWDERYHPPRLLAATVRFARPGAPSAKHRRKSGTGEPKT